MNSRRINILVTGGTGFVGKAILARLADEPAYGTVYLLVRGRRDQSAAERVATIISRMFPNGRMDELKAKFRAVEGDLEVPGLGLTEETVALLTREVQQILHVGASTDFGAPLAASRLCNVEGTRHVLDLAVRFREGGCLERLDYVSTAYVAGTLEGFVDEDTLVRRQEFANNYERSKYEAELLVRDYAKVLPTAVYRPSIIVGDAKNGYTPHFKVLYWPLMLLSKNLLPFFAVNPRAHLDVVPVDYTADAVVALMQQPSSLGETFHLTAGLGREIRIRDLLRDAYQLAAITRRPMIPFWLFHVISGTPLRRLFADQFWQAVEMATPYFCYFKGAGVRFDAARTQATLARLGIEVPSWSDYKREVLGFCVASRWGKKLPLPEYIYYLPSQGRRVKEPQRGSSAGTGQQNGPQVQSYTLVGQNA